MVSSCLGLGLEAVLESLAVIFQHKCNQARCPGETWQGRMEEPYCIPTCRRRHSCCLSVLYETYFHFLWPLLLAGQWQVKGGGITWHLLKGKLKSPQADGRICFAQDGGLDLRTMGNWGERGLLTAPFYGWKVGLREGKSIHLATHRELQTVGRGVIQGSQCGDCPSSSESYVYLPDLCPQGPSI